MCTMNSLNFFAFQENIRNLLESKEHTYTWDERKKKKRRAKKCDAWNSFNKRKKGEMLNDFVEWLMMCVLN